MLMRMGLFSSPTPKMVGGGGGSKIPIAGSSHPPARGGGRGKRELHLLTSGGGAPRQWQCWQGFTPCLLYPIELAWDRGVSLRMIASLHQKIFFSLWMGVRMAPRAGLAIFPD